MIDPPSRDQLAAYARRYGLSLSSGDFDAIISLSEGIRTSYGRIDGLPDALSASHRHRPAGHAPAAQDNPFNAWAWRSHIEGAADGPLKGVRVGVKDNICVAGLPLRNGSHVFDGFVPRQDATVVARVLAAGGIIVGKTTCEDLCFSGGSHTSQPAPVLNPFDPTRSAGGSSSGNAVAIAVGDVTMCIGGDQGGSVRTPASWCGIVGLKPTHGLVPYTGAFALEPTVDHLGPMGRSVADVARLLTVIAGNDGLDPRQPRVERADYVGAVDLPLRGLRIGVVRQGFGRPESLAATDDSVRKALARLAKDGATIDEVSIPWHTDGYHLSAPILIEGAMEYMFTGNAVGYGLKGYHPYEMSNFWSGAWRRHVNELPDIAKLVLLLGSHMRDAYAGSYYSKAQNLRYELRKAYDAAFEQFDVLAMPTTPMTATKLSDGAGDFGRRVEAGLNMECNTAPFDVSGHPAISVPCGLANGLPVGLMFIARQFDERSALRAAAAFERLGDWKTM
jgi:amidase